MNKVRQISPSSPGKGGGEREEGSDLKNLLFLVVSYEHVLTNMGLLWNCSYKFVHIRMSCIKNVYMFLIYNEKNNNCWNDHKKINRDAKKHTTWKKAEQFLTQIVKMKVHEKKNLLKKSKNMLNLTGRKVFF